MPLLHLLKDEKSSILDEWIDRVLASYPADSAQFFKKKKDRFANPLGHSVAQGLAEVYAFICGDKEAEALGSNLEHLVNIRAVGELSASDAVSFIYELKKVVADACRKEKHATATLNEWLDFDTKVDSVAMMVFDLYTASRERLYQIRINDFKTGRHHMTGAKCPSAMMRENKQEKQELNIFNNHSSK